MNTTIKIFGIGLNKTGTKTLGKCMEYLGFANKSYDFELLLDYSKDNYHNIINTISSFDSFEDWPWPLIYKKIDLLYPNAKFILSTRLNSEIWFNSLCKHANKTGPTEARKIAYGYSMPMENPEHHKQIYKLHNSNVHNYFLGRPAKLLTVCWEKGDGWQQICSFLDIPVPDMPFPHVNKSITKKGIT